MYIYIFIHMGFPKSSKSLDHVRIETHGDLEYPHFRKPQNIYIHV